ncbi:MAG: hypothetical protein II888_04685 [Clostridia bacterium]|nr:hypothetical protein [Clostridia bacterium]
MIRKLRHLWLFIMQKWLIIPIIVLIFAAVALVIPLFSRVPTAADDGTAWNPEWEMMGTVMGVEAPGNGFTLLNNDTALAGNDTFYASWVAGEARDYTNADGKHVDLYPAQIYLLLYGCGDREQAEEARAEWMAREENTYRVEEKRSETHNGQDFQVLIYACGSETNPYERGASAFGVFGNYVVIAELTCTEDYEGDAAAQLGEFLDGCHYGSENLKKPAEGQ